MIQADKQTMVDWCDRLARDIGTFSNVLEADTDYLTWGENVSYRFAILAMQNLNKVSPDEASVDVLTLHAAQGLMRGACEALALIEPAALFVANERKN
jgi:hypothetical protein